MDLSTPEELKINIDNYNGPLEALLDLAKLQKVDLTNISITQLADQFIEFINTAKKIKLEIFSTPFDEDSVDLLEKFNVPFYKIASVDAVQAPAPSDTPELTLKFLVVMVPNSPA